MGNGSPINPQGSQKNQAPVKIFNEAFDKKNLPDNYILSAPWHKYIGKYRLLTGGHKALHHIIS
jgi:hypothetical protein